MKKLGFLLLTLFVFKIVSAQEPMITRWEFTDQTTIEFATKGSANYEIKDTDDNIVASGNLIYGINTITVPTPGEYFMEIFNTENFAFRMYNHIAPKEFKELIQWGDTDLDSDLTHMFSHLDLQITASDIPNFKPDTNASYMFFLAHNFNGNLSNWNVSNITNMSAMFSGAYNFNSDLSNWDVSNVTDTSEMFSECHNFESDLSNWDVSNITGPNMMAMFDIASSFTSDLSGWDVNATRLDFLFSNASNFTSDLSGWDVSDVTNFHIIFYKSGMTCHDYSKTLIGWAQQDVNPDMEMKVEGLKYDNTAVDARVVLIQKGWNFIGDVHVENCNMNVSDIGEEISDIKVISPVKDDILLISNEKIKRTEVYDLTGKKVKEFKGMSASANDLSKGVYLLKIYTNRSVKNIKIIKD